MKLLLILYLLLSVSIAETINKSTNFDKEELERILNAEGAIQDENINEVLDTKKKEKAKRTTSTTYNDDTYEDVATYYLINADMLLRQKMGVRYASDNKNLLKDNVSLYTAMIEKQKKEALAREQAKIIPEDTIVSITGYCTNRNEVEIEQIQGYSILECSFDENDFGLEDSTIFVSFIPIANKNALIAKPIYIQKGTRKVHITNGVILTVDRTSLNVANFINDKKLEKIAGKLMTATSHLALNSSMLYMQQKELSKRNEELVYNNSVAGTQVVKTSNIQSPNASDYLANFGIQFLSGLVNIAGNLFSENDYPLFKVYKNSQFYVDFSITYNSKNKKAVDYLKEDYTKIKENTTNGLDFNFQLPSSTTNTAIQK